MNGLCSHERLELALAGKLDADEESRLHLHLEVCELCAAEMERLAGGEQASREIAALLMPDALDDALPLREECSTTDFVVDHLEPSDDPAVLGRLGGYDVLDIIGRGGMGVVLKGFDRELKRFVAIKALAPHLAHSALARKRFAREAQAAAAVVNLHVIAIHQVQPNGQLPFLVMPLLTGESLAQRLQARGTLDLKEVLRIGMQAAEGLAAAHGQGLIHRDVKPANILLEKGVERAVLTDFGLARAADDVSMTRWGIIAGTPEYMSPEQARGEALDGRSDLFSLGCVLYEMATGVSPFRTDSTMATLRRIVDEQPAAMASLVPELPPWFSHIVERLLSKAPAQRFASASEVSQLLKQCLSHLQQPTSVPLPASLVPHAAGRRSIFNVTRKGMIAILGIIGMTLLGMVLRQSTETPTPDEKPVAKPDWVVAWDFRYTLLNQRYAMMRISRDGKLEAIFPERPLLRTQLSPDELSALVALVAKNPQTKSRPMTKAAEYSQAVTPRPELFDAIKQVNVRSEIAAAIYEGELFEIELNSGESHVVESQLWKLVGLAAIGGSIELPRLVEVANRELKRKYPDVSNEIDQTHFSFAIVDHPSGNITVWFNLNVDPASKDGQVVLRIPLDGQPSIEQVVAPRVEKPEPDSKLPNTAVPATELPKVQNTVPERKLAPVDGPPVNPRLADDEYTKSGVRLAEQTWPMPPWGAEKDGLSAGIRIIGDTRIGGEVKAELWVRNSGAKDVKFSQNSRTDIGLKVIAKDKKGEEHYADITQFDGYPIFSHLLLPAGHIVKVKEFTLRLDAQKNKEVAANVAGFHLPPGDYKLHVKWSDSHSLVTHTGDWTGELTTGEVDLKIAAADAGTVPRGSPDAVTTKTEVKFDGRRVPVMRDNDQVIVLNPPDARQEIKKPGERVAVLTPRQIVENGAKLYHSRERIAVQFKVQSTAPIIVADEKGTQHEQYNLYAEDVPGFSVCLTDKAVKALKSRDVEDVDKCFVGKWIRVEGTAYGVGLDLIYRETLWTYHLDLNSLDQLSEVEPAALEARAPNLQGTATDLTDQELVEISLGAERVDGEESAAATPAPKAKAADRGPEIDAAIARQRKLAAMVRKFKIDAAIARLREQGAMVREFHPRGNPQYWVQITSDNFDDDNLADVEMVARGVPLHLHLRNASVTPAGLERLASAGRINQLELSGDNIDDALLKSLPKLPLHGQLGLYSDKLTNAGVQPVAECLELTAISLEGNLSDDSLERLAGLPNLQRISLGKHFTRRAFDILGRVENLTDLDVSELNPDLIDLQKIPKLRTLSLSGKKYDDAAALAIADTFKSLESAYLRGTSITNAGVEHLSRLEKLKILTLDDSLVDDGMAKSIRKMKQLTWLSVGNCAVGDDTVAALSECPEMWHVFLAGTQVTDKGMVHLPKLMKPLALYLFECKLVTDASIKSLAQLPDSAGLNVELTGSGVTEKGFSELKAALPHAQIRWAAPAPPK